MNFDQAPKALTPEEISARRKSRIKSDAKLVRGGADVTHDEGIIRATEKQKGEAEEEMKGDLDPLTLQTKERAEIKGRIEREGASVEKNVNGTRVSLYNRGGEYHIYFNQDPKSAPKPRWEPKEKTSAGFGIPEWDSDTAIEIFEWAIKLAAREADLNKIADEFQDHISTPES